MGKKLERLGPSCSDISWVTAGSEAGRPAGPWSVSGSWPDSLWWLLPNWRCQLNPFSLNYDRGFWFSLNIFAYFSLLTPYCDIAIAYNNTKIIVFMNWTKLLTMLPTSHPSGSELSEREGSKKQECWMTGSTVTQFMSSHGHNYKARPSLVTTWMWLWKHQQSVIMLAATILREGLNVFVPFFLFLGSF